MLNKFWFWLLAIGILYGLGKACVQEWQLGGDVPVADAETAEGEEQEPPKRPIVAAGEALSNASLDGATLAVEICIGLIGAMVLWLGILNVAKDAGLVDALAYVSRPVMRWLFPDVPNGHPAQGAMLMNISANVLGLDNAATPFGLQAMRELQTLNKTDDTATNAMATFLAINTSNVTLVPIAIIALRVAAGSEEPTRPIAGMILATSVATIVAIVAVRILQRRTPDVARSTEP